METYNRKFPFKKGYTPKASEDSCRYCVHGVVHEPFVGDSSRFEWCCGKTCGVFSNIGDYCGHYTSLDEAKADLHSKYIIKTKDVNPKML